MMKYLLDTSVWLWSLGGSDRINAEGLQVLAGGRDDLYLSAASSWEIAIKSAIGRLRLPEPVAIYVPKRMAAQGIRPLPISHAHALAVAELPRHHNDPFDRLIIAQAQAEEMAIMTADRAFRRYQVSLLWCGF